MRTIAARRAAEANVIAAARQVIRDNFDHIATDALYRAIEELDAVGLADPTNARSRGWPLTSVQAAEWMKGDYAGSIAAKIVDQLRRRADGITVEELCGRLNGKHQTISARVNELRDAGWIQASEHRRQTSSGLWAICWVLTPEALRHIREARDG